MENQQTIVEWATETFGKASTTKLAVRAVEEAAELCKAYYYLGTETLEGRLAIAQEAADVFITCCQVAERFNVTMVIKDGNIGDHPKFTAHITNLTGAILGATVDEKIHITPLLRAVEATLADLCESVGFELSIQVESKMEVNRLREWDVDEGIGQHLRELTDQERDLIRDWSHFDSHSTMFLGIPARLVEAEMQRISSDES